MNQRRLLPWLLLFLAAGCLPVEPPVIDPPTPPVLTAKQRQKVMYEALKERGRIVDPNTTRRPTGLIYPGLERTP